MTDRQLFKETFSQLHASEDTIAEVMKMANTQHERKKMRRPARMGALIALAAVLLMGTAFAAVTYHLHTEPVGDLGLAVSIAAEGDAPGAVAFSGEGAEVTYYDLDIVPGWLPEGMVNVPGETVKWDYEDNGFRGGFSIGSGPLNTGDATFCDMVTDAESQESLSVNGHEAFYIRRAGDDGFNQRLYVSYPECNAVLTIYVGSNITKDEAVKFAENLSVSVSDRALSSENLEYNGKLYLDIANYIATGVYENTADFSPSAELPGNILPAQQAAAENMANAKAVGESYTVRVLDHAGVNDVKETELPIKVVDYAIADDTSILRDASCLDGDVAKLLDENGKLPEDTLRFYVSGNGITAPSSTVVAEQAQQPKLVAVTFEVTNNTDSTLSDIIYGGRLMAVEETADGWAEYKPVPESGAADYDYFSGEAWESLEVMRYWDVVEPESNGGNSIRDLAPDESITVQVAFVVNECEADHLWFYFYAGNLNDVSEGYVALRP